MKHIFSITTILFSLIMAALLVPALSGCSDDTFSRFVTDEYDGPVVKAYLSLSVNDFSVASEGTRTEYPNETDKETATEDENRIENIWVFQFGADGNQLIAPYYYKITEQEQLENLDKVEVLLKEGVSSTVFVVANTSDPDWAKGDGFNTLEGLKGKALSKPDPILFSSFSPIPMEGSISEVTVAEGSTVTVGVSRMFAKLKISFDNLVAGMTPKSIQISNIPYYCKVNSLGDGIAEENAATYELTASDWRTRSINTASGAGAYTDGKEYAVYIPENLQGEKGEETDNKTGITSENAEERVPDHALVINLEMDYTDPETGATRTLNYAVYPGGNIYNNFNVRRNCVYRVRINIASASESNHTPSSNCFVVIPGRTLSFEPYYRTEKGGGYNIANYLTPDDPDKTIRKVDIIWQTWNAIGDNSAGNLVQFIPDPDPDPNNAIHSEIIVKTKMEGNALIGAYNEAGDILWSWHIWITDNDPGNVGNAIVYTTYAWDSTGIKYNEHRVEGYAIMPCNLGALANTPEDTGNENTPDNWYCKEKRAYGILYQWGRKDPFPPMKRDLSKLGYYKYDNEVVEVYNNSNELIEMSTNGYVVSTNELFQTVLTYDVSKNQGSPVGSTFESGIDYSIKHPTTHIAGATRLNGSNFNDPGNYLNGGNWLPVNDQCLWGAKEIDSSAEHYSPYANRAIWRNYNEGPENKTIFDPCPAGWRVPPGDLWLGFTNNGLNTGRMSNSSMSTLANVPEYFNHAYMLQYRGYWLCLDGWRTEKTENPTNHTFFSTQGSRLASGEPMHPGICGNYHNATPDLQDKSIQRVNILHLHTDNTEIKINTFEDQLLYYNKSVAGPIRCVRDRR